MSTVHPASPQFMPWISSRIGSSTPSAVRPSPGLLTHALTFSATKKKNVLLPGFEPTNFRQLGRWSHQLNHRGVVSTIRLKPARQQGFIVLAGVAAHPFCHLRNCPGRRICCISICEWGQDDMWIGASSRPFHSFIVCFAGVPVKNLRVERTSRQILVQGHDPTTRIVGFTCWKE